MLDQRAKDLIAQGDVLFSKRSSLMSLWQTIADNFYVERADSVTLHPAHAQLDPREAKPLGHLAQGVLGRTGVEQRGQEHVARETANAIQVRNHSRPRAIRAAIVPAPNPSSMPTTASAAAQEVSIAFSAVRPPSAMP